MSKSSSLAINDLDDFVQIPDRWQHNLETFSLYMILVSDRDNLMTYLIQNGVEAKIHYPIPIYKQEALAPFVGDRSFEMTDFFANNSISFPCDQHLTMIELDEIVETVKRFYET